jgi:hypothetical protein
VSRQEPIGRAAGWAWIALGGAVAITLFAGGGVWLLSSPTGEAPAEATSRSTAPAAEPGPQSATPSWSADTDEPSPSQARCWDGSQAEALDACSLPEGAAGLAWLFPQLPGQICRPPKQAGHGVVVRVLCSATLSDGSTVKAGYYQWESVAAADDYYDGQPLRRVDSEGFHGWRAVLGRRIKKAVLYADAPYSRTLMYRTSASGTPELQHLQPRAPEHVRGEPVG